jgi:hypothetical protein
MAALETSQAEASRSGVEQATAAPAGEAQAWAPRRGGTSLVDFLGVADVRRRAHVVLGMQRAVGNHSVAGMLARQGPHAPVGPMGVVVHGLGHVPSPLEQVRDRLGYGVIDWVVTDEDAGRALDVLAALPDDDLAHVIAELDDDSTPYLDRLVNNAPLETVRSEDFARVMSARAPARNRVLVEQLVSYGFADWEITPPEAEAAQTLLDSLPARDARRLTDDWVRERIRDNLAGEDDYEQGIGEMLLEGALEGDYVEDPTFWHTISQIVVGFIPYAGQVADARDLVRAIEKLDESGWRSGWEWMNLVLILIGFIPGFGDIVKGLGRSGLRALRNSGLPMLSALFDGARALIEPIVRQLLVPAIESVKAFIRRIVDTISERIRRLAPGEPAPRGGPDAPPGGSVVDEAGEAMPSPAQLTADAEQAMTDAARGAGRRADDIASEFIHAVLDGLKAWCKRIFADLGVRDVRVEIHGEWIELHGSRLIRVRKRAVVEVLIEKSESVIALIRARQGKLTAARNAGTESARNLLRNDACQISEEIGERIAEVAMRRTYSGATIRFRGSGSGVVDQVFEHGGLLYVVEAKGGGSRLGWRQIGADEWAQQGTLAYLDDVIRQMAGSSDSATRAIARELADGRRRREVVYLIARTGPLNATSEPLRATLTSIRQ